MSTDISLLGLLCHGLEQNDDDSPKNSRNHQTNKIHHFCLNEIHSLDLNSDYDGY